MRAARGGWGGGGLCVMLCFVGWGGYVVGGPDRPHQYFLFSGAMSVTKKKETEDRYDGGENGRDTIATIKIGIQ